MLKLEKWRFTTTQNWNHLMVVSTECDSKAHIWSDSKLGPLPNKKSRNGDTLDLVELIVWPKQGNQGDWHEQDDQGEVSIIIFGMSKSSGFQNYSVCLCLWLCLCCCICHWLCLCICVLFYDFWIAFIISFQNMYGYRSLWRLWAA